MTSLGMRHRFSFKQCESFGANRSGLRIRENNCGSDHDEMDEMAVSAGR
jgi:hypothetical protein